MILFGVKEKGLRNGYPLSRLPELTGGSDVVTNPSSNTLLLLCIAAMYLVQSP